MPDQTDIDGDIAYIFHIGDQMLAALGQVFGASIRMLHISLSLILALTMTIGTTWINPVTDEKTMYGHEGPLEQNWLPREVAGWPAPFLADNPDTSVIHNVGIEDNFRLGAFAGTLSFWFVVVSAVGRLMRRLKRKTASGPPITSELEARVSDFQTRRNSK